MDPKAVVGNHLRNARRRARRTQQEAADHIGVSRQTILNWEGGETMPDEDERTRLARFYGVSVGELCYGSDANAYRRGIRDAAVLLQQHADAATVMPEPETHFEESQGEDMPDPAGQSVRRRKAR